jgi:putative spermidine/putrescine transport system ATP-binding protein
MTMSQQNEIGLELKGLSKVLGGRVIIDNLDLQVKKGEMVSLLGPSGCGKTTTLRMIAGFLIPDNGTVTLAGKDVTTIGPEKRPSAMVFQNYALWPHMTVFKNVAYPLKVRKVSKNEIEKRVHDVLGVVNLMHHKDSRPAQISGGEQQRVALARALVQEPDILLLDEPLSNLDAKLRVKVREDIRDLQRRLGITTVIVTHDQDEALSISDRIAVMKEGKIEQFSTPEDIYNKPATEYVANFIGSLNRYEGSYSNGQIASGKDVVGVRPEDVTFDSKSSAGAVEATVSLVVPRGHFHEVYLKRSDVEIRAFISSEVPAVGAKGYAKIHKALIYRNGKLASVE